MSPFWSALNNIGIALTLLIAMLTIVRRAAQLVKNFRALVNSHESLVSRVEELSKVIGGIRDELSSMTDTLGHPPGA